MMMYEKPNSLDMKMSLCENPLPARKEEIMLIRGIRHAIGDKETSCRSVV
jgi:hypothetical protein